MFTILFILGIIAAILMILVVLIQNPKGGGLASNFSAGNQFFGARQTTEGIEKLTWGLSIAILVIALVFTQYNGTFGEQESSSPASEAIKNAKAPREQPIAPPANTTTPPANTPPAAPID